MSLIIQLNYQQDKNLDVEEEQNAKEVQSDGELFIKLGMCQMEPLPRKIRISKTGWCKLKESNYSKWVSCYHQLKQIPRTRRIYL